MKNRPRGLPSLGRTPRIFAAVVAAAAITTAATASLQSIVRAAGTGYGPACSSANPCLYVHNSGTGSAVRARAERNDGVQGITSNSPGNLGDPLANNAGIRGKDLSTSSTDQNFGVLGISRNWIGVAGATFSTSGGPGVVGADLNPSPTSQNAGVYGTSLNNIGTLGTSDNGQAVFAQTKTGTAVFAAGRYGNAIIAENNSSQFTTLALTNFKAGGKLLRGFNKSKEVASLDNAGNLVIAGSLQTGAQPMVSLRSNSRGSVLAFGSKQTVSTIDDVGEAQLRYGQVFVRLDPSFASTVDLARPYLVFVTPQGETRGTLYVSQKNSSGFIVRENQGGRSSVAFDYRIVAKPLGDRSDRLPSAISQATSAETLRFQNMEQRLPHLLGFGKSVSP